MKLAALSVCVAFTAAWCAQPQRSRRAMVVSGESNATDVGLAVLRSGGNAVDAAISMGFVLAVTHSAMCGLGGGGQVLVRDAAGRTAYFDFREQAPGKSSRTMFLDAKGNLAPDSAIGWRASAVPGMVRGYETMHRRYGRKPWRDLLTPAITLARQGHPLSYMRATMLRDTARLAGDPETKRIFLKGGAFFQPGDQLVQTELAATLERLARVGPEDFYTGETARRLVAEMERHGGLITAEDLKNYRVAEPAPLSGRYRGIEVLTASGSSAGGLGLLQMLGVLAGSGYEKTGAGSAASIHFLAETMRRVFADRSEYSGDPDFVKVPVADLLSPAYLARLRTSIDPARATPSDRIRPARPGLREGNDTTHYGVVDEQGNAVAATITLNSAYGSSITVPGLGFFLNNNMDNFAANPGKTNQYGLRQGEANAIQPGKRPVSSMTPAILVRDGRLFMIVGTPGGPTVTNSVLQAIVNVVDFGMNAQDAVNAPRMHHQWYPDRLVMEPGFSPDTIALLKSRGHEIEPRPSNNDLNMILLDGGWIQAAVDPRREGKASGF